MIDHLFKLNKQIDFFLKAKIKVNDLLLDFLFF